jgi:hypothetical protein
MITYRILGTNDDQDTCTLCGKTHLKKVVWLEALDSEGNPTGNIAPYGCDCAGQLVHGKKTRKNGEIVLHRAKAYEYARKWIQAGYDKEQVIQAVWNRFGLTDSRTIVEMAINN